MTFKKIIVKNSFKISILYKISLFGIGNIFLLKKYFLKQFYKKSFDFKQNKILFDF